MQGAQTEEIGTQVRQRLVDIVQESGTVVEEAENIVRRASRPDLATDGGATCAKPSPTRGATCTEPSAAGGDTCTESVQAVDARFGDVTGPKSADSGEVTDGDTKSNAKSVV